MFNNCLLIFIGGGTGSIMRYILSVAAARNPRLEGLPAGTFFVNIFGCLLIGILFQTIDKEYQSAKLLLITGFCGGFTTFSAFSLENFEMLQRSDYWPFILNVSLSTAGGVMAVALGFGLARYLGFPPMK